MILLCNGSKLSKYEPHPEPLIFFCFLRKLVVQNLVQKEYNGYMKDIKDIWADYECEGQLEMNLEIEHEPVIYGYARVSTSGQANDGNSLEAQAKLLRANGATVIIKETFTGTTADRPKFKNLIENIVKPGDTIMTTKLDRFARTAIDGCALVDKLLEQGIFVHSLDIGLMNNSTSGRLIRQIMFAFAEMERNLIVERFAEGKAIAREKPGYKEGRPKKLNKEQISLICDLRKKYSIKTVAEMMNVSQSTIKRAIKEGNADNEL